MANSNAFSESLARINAKETNNRKVEQGMKVNKWFTSKGVGGNATNVGVINRPTKPTSQH